MTETCEDCHGAVEGELTWISRKCAKCRMRSARFSRDTSIDINEPYQDVRMFHANPSGVHTLNEKKRIKKHGYGWNKDEQEQINKGNIDYMSPIDPLMPEGKSKHEIRQWKQRHWAPIDSAKFKYRSKQDAQAEAERRWRENDPL